MNRRRSQTIHTINGVLTLLLGGLLFTAAAAPLPDKRLAAFKDLKLYPRLLEAVQPILTTEKLLQHDVLVPDDYYRGLEAIEALPNPEAFYRHLMDEPGLKTGGRETDGQLEHFIKAWKTAHQMYKQAAIRIENKLFENQKQIMDLFDDDFAGRLQLAQELYASGIVIPEFYEEVASKLEQIPRRFRSFKNLSGNDYPRLRRIAERFAGRITEYQKFELKLREASLKQRQEEAFRKNVLARKEFAIEAA
ncbi:MAG: hypothetical protein AAF492_11510, partial [Verrucomicrobiota bacterium]